jgi:hypothetical protein
MPTRSLSARRYRLRAEAYGAAFVRVKPVSCTGIFVTTTSGLSYLASVSDSDSDIGPKYYSLRMVSMISNAPLRCSSMSFMCTSIDAESGWTCTTLAVLPSSSK